MSHKLKSTIYFASLVIAMVTYYNISSNNSIQNTEMAENSIEQVTIDKLLP